MKTLRDGKEWGSEGPDENETGENTNEDENERGMAWRSEGQDENETGIFVEL